MDGCNNRLRAGFDCVDHVWQGRRNRWFAEFSDVCASKECAAVAADHDCLHGVISQRFFDTSLQASTDSLSERVHWWVVGNDYQDFSVLVSGNDTHSGSPLFLKSGGRMAVIRTSPQERLDRVLSPCKRQINQKLGLHAEFICLRATCFKGIGAILLRRPCFRGFGARLTCLCGKAKRAETLA